MTDHQMPFGTTPAREVESAGDMIPEGREPEGIKIWSTDSFDLLGFITLPQAKACIQLSRRHMLD